jgi:hypothetical protein
MNEYSGNYDSNLATSLPIWFGRVASSDSWHGNIEASHLDPKDQKGWGGPCRVRIRIFNYHSGDSEELPDDQLPMAFVSLPTTAGSGLGGFTDTPTLSAGTLVWGFYRDGMAGQEPYIIGILPNTNNDVPKQQPKGPIGAHQLFNDTYQSCFVPDYLQTIKPIERPSNAAPTTVPQQQTPLTIDQLRQRTAEREAAGSQLGSIAADAETQALIAQENYIGLTGELPPG